MSSDLLWLEDVAKIFKISTKNVLTKTCIVKSVSKIKDAL